MPTSIADVFRMRSIRAEHQGMSAKILPVTTVQADELDQTGIRQGVCGGQMQLFWNDATGRNGKVFDIHVRNDLTVIIRRNEGSDLRVRADRMPDAAMALLRAEKSALKSSAEVTKAYGRRGGRGNRLPLRNKSRSWIHCGRRISRTMSLFAF